MTKTLRSKEIQYIHIDNFFKNKKKYNCNAKIMKETIITNNNIMSRNSNNNNIKSKHHKFQVQNLK